MAVGGNPIPSQDPQPPLMSAGMWLWVVTATAVVGMLFAACGRLGWPFELATHFRVQYLLALLAGTA